MRLLVLGAAGHLGSAILHAAMEGIEIAGARRADADITDADAVRALVANSAAEVVVNTAAWAAVDVAETDPEGAWAVNERGAANVAAACAATGAALIHISTDYVFDGRRGHAYREEDEPAPVNEYGRSKLAGERAVAATLERHAIVRTSWLFGSESAGFVPAIAARGRDGKPVSAVADQYGCPTAVADLAPALLLLARLLADRAAAAHGLLHLSGSPATTRLGLARCVLDALGGHAATLPLEPIASADFGAAARRPASTPLDSSRATRLLGLDALDWRPRLRDLVRRLTTRH